MAARTRQVPLVIQNGQIPSSLTDFPVLITRACLPDEICSPSDGNAAQADGGDLEFYSDSGGVTRLYADVVAWEHDTTDAAGDAEIEIWVKVPSVSGTVDTTIYCRYNGGGSETQPAANATGGSEGVWSDYAGTWHFSEDGSGGAGSILDATANNIDGTPTGATLTAGVSAAAPWGVTGGALDFENSTPDYVELGTDAIDAGTGNFTATAWIKYEATGSYQAIFGNSDNTALLFQGGTKSWFINTANGFVDPALAVGLSNGVWYHVAFRRDGTTFECWIDGGGSSTATHSGTFQFGRLCSRSPASQAFDGLADEMRIRLAALSDGWIEAEYNNQSSPATFIVEGTPTDVGGGGGSTTNQSLTGTLTRSAALATQATFGRTLTGAMSRSATMAEAFTVNQSLTGSLTRGASIVKLVQKGLSAGVARTAAFTKRVSKGLTASMARTASIDPATSFQQALAGAMSRTASLAAGSRFTQSLTASMSRGASLATSFVKASGAILTKILWPIMRAILRAPTSRD